MDFDRMEAARGANALVVVGVLDRTTASKRGPNRGDRRSGCGVTICCCRCFFWRVEVWKKDTELAANEHAIHKMISFSLYSLSIGC